MASHFIWYELITSDLDAAIAYYGDVLGWTVAPSRMTGMDYRTISAAGTDIGGMMAVPEEAKGMPPGWFGYVNVADVDAEVEAFTAAGGHVAWPANDIPNVGRMAMVVDPQGALIYVMTPSMEGASTAFKPGTLGHCGWNEYHATDAVAAYDFYAGRMGWEKCRSMDMGPAGVYQTFQADGVELGGMMNNPLPQQAWLYYFITGDIDAAVERLTKGGGAVQMGPMEVPDGQWAVVAKDPQGAMFGLLGTRA